VDAGIRAHRDTKAELVELARLLATAYMRHLRQTAEKRPKGVESEATDCRLTTCYMPAVE